MVRMSAVRCKGFRKLISRIQLPKCGVYVVQLRARNAVEIPFEISPVVTYASAFMFNKKVIAFRMVKE
jgi:hypothetical protein